MWLGYSDLRQEGVFVDNFHKPPAKTYWHAGEPNNIGSERFTMLAYHQYGDWNNSNGATKLPYACQFTGGKFITGPK